MATRNHKKEYASYHSKSAQKKNRAGRNKARRSALAAGKVKKGNGKDVHHKDGNPRAYSFPGFHYTEDSNLR